MSVVAAVRRLPLVRFAGFALVGLSGVAPNLFVTWLLVDVARVHYLVAAVVATEVAIGWNFVLMDLVVFRRRRGRPWSARFGRFLVVNNVDLAVRLPVLAALVGWLRLDELVATAATIAAAFVVRFALVDRLIYVAAPMSPPHAPPPHAPPPHGRAGRVMAAREV